MSTRVQPISADRQPESIPASTKTAPSPQTTRATPHPRWLLSIEASVWRFLIQIGFYFHNLPNPRPNPPSFIRHFPTTAASGTGPATLQLAFYVPGDYALQISKGRRYPIVVNLHGGGFTMGSASDDGRWAAVVLKDVDAICVSVEYRLAPEFPFPTAVEDGVEALLYLAANADDFGLDPKKIALSGFSAGGNMSFTMPLRLQTHLQSIKNEHQSKSTSGSRPTPQLPEIVSIIAWYPSLDARLTRDERRTGCVRPDKSLPPILTNLFDESYMPELDNKSSPYASPAAATDEELVSALPYDIAMYLCEWDMLLQEGEVFAERLKKLGKRVHVVIIKERRHGFDKSPYPFSVDPEVMIHYREACELLRDTFGVSYNTLT